jgi:hypothetical protein
LFIFDDNFLSLNKILEVKQLVAKENKEINWISRTSTTSIGKYLKLKDNSITVSEDSQESHGASIYNTKFSSVHDLGSNILHTFAKKNGIEIKEILRIKANILNKTDKQDHIHPPHVDMTTPHMVLLYYVNDSDGDTIIFNEKHSSQQDPILTVDKAITPKAGAGIVFDGLTYHSSSSPKNTKERIVLNINFTCV